MKKNKVRFNRPPLSSEEISGYKNFGSLEQRYQSAQRFQYVKWGGATLSAAAIALIVMLTVWKTPEGEKTVARAFIHPPLQHVNIAYSNYTVDAAQGGELKYESGSVIRIPQHAFLDKNGNVVTGAVDLKYREFHDPADFFLSGIPMSYDSGGTQYHFESAGMVEIAAYKGGEPLLVNPESRIDISMASNQKENKYNLYYLDTVKKQWVNKGRDKMEQLSEEAPKKSTPKPAAPKPDSDRVLKDLATRMLTIQSDVREAQDEKPFKPIKANNEAYIFDFDVSPKEFPEMALYEGMFFQIGEENENFNPSLYQHTWEDAELRENIRGVNYLLRLKKGGETHEFIVYPVYKGQSYTTAVKMYEQKYKEYEAALAEKREQEKKLKQEYEERMKQLEASRQAEMKAWEAQQQKRIEFSTSVDKVYRTFQVDGFGIWNCDRPFIQEWKAVIAKFTDSTGKEIKLDFAYVADKERNLMIQWYPDEFRAFRFNPQGNQMIWGVTPDNKLAVLSYEDFKALPKASSNYTLRMTTTDKLFTSVGEVKDFLGI